MPELPARKVGIVACSGEELAEGTVTRLAALRVLEQLRPGETVTICLPLFLAGGRGDRAFARFYPTIALDGCEERCAARATEEHSGRPAAAVVVRDLVREAGLGRPQGARRLDESGRRAVAVTAARVAGLVDELLGAAWNPRRGSAAGPAPAREPVPPAGEPAPAREPVPAVGPAPSAAEAVPPAQTGCACASAIPIEEVDIDGRTVPLAALPLVFAQFHEAGRTPGAAAAAELLDVVRIYNDVPAGTDAAYLAALERAYAAFCDGKRA